MMGSANKDKKKLKKKKLKDCIKTVANISKTKVDFSARCEDFLKKKRKLKEERSEEVFNEL